MTNKEQITQLIFETIDEINQLLSDEKQLTKSLETILFGQGGQLDSLGLVNFIVSTEQRVKKETNVVITLVDDRAMTQEDSPLKTVGSLTDYVMFLLEEHANT